MEFKREKGGFSTVFYRTTSGEFADEGIDNGVERKLEKRMKDTGNQFPEKVPRKSSQKILDFIKENPELTITELAQRTGISDRAVKKNIKKLKEKGLLRRVGADTSGHWEVVGKSHQKGWSEIEKATERDTVKDTEAESLIIQDKEKKILEEIRKNPRITAEQLSKILHINLRNTKKYFANLKKKGLLRRIGADRGGHWEVIRG